MKSKAILVATLMFGVALSSHAATYSFSTNAYANSTAGGSGAGAGLVLNAGESFLVSTDPSQIWHGAALGDGNYDLLTTNADGSAPTSYATFLAGISGPVQVGTLVADINGQYRIIGAGVKNLSAWDTGEIFFHYADINQFDNSGTIVSTLTTAVPEPSAVALLLAGLGLVGGVASRRKAVNP